VGLVKGIFTSLRNWVCWKKQPGFRKKGGKWIGRFRRAGAGGEPIWKKAVGHDDDAGDILQGENNPLKGNIRKEKE